MCSLGTLQNGEQASLDILVQAMATGVITHTVHLSGDSADPDTTNNQVSETTTVTSATGADLGISMVSSAETVTVGQTYTYTLVINNQGPSDAMGVSVTDILPSQVSYVSATPSQGSCQNMGDVICVLGTIFNGGQVTINLVVQGLSEGTAVNSANVSSTSNDPLQTNNIASVDVIITSNYSTKIFIPLVMR